MRPPPASVPAASPDVRLLAPVEAAAHLPALAALLQATVAGGASVGFLPPVPAAEAAAYWRGVIDGVGRGERVLLVALDGGRLVGTVQLALERRPTGRHRGEVQKLMVDPAERGRGVAAALMAAVEDVARHEGRSLLVLDTAEGCAAERLYRRLGWTECGRIPGWARDADGVHATVLFHRELAADAG